MSVNTNIKSAVITFLEHLEVERNVSSLTIRNYSHYLRRFADWFIQQGHDDIKQLNLDLVRSYRVYLARYLDPKKNQNLSKRTQSYYIISLRSFLKWLIKQDISVLHPEKIDLPKSEAHQMKFLSLEKVELLLAQPLLSSTLGLRDRAILEVLFSTGLRVSELVSLNRDQVDIPRREFGVIGKGRKPRVVFLSDRAAHCLERWLATREDFWQPIFTRLSGKIPDITSDGSEMRLSARSVQRIVEKYCRKAHLPIRISPHGMRHSFATDLLANGAGLREVQEMLGHKNIATTQIYTHVTHPKLREVHQKMHSKLK